MNYDEVMKKYEELQKQYKYLNLRDGIYKILCAHGLYDLDYSITEEILKLLSNK